MAPFYALHGAAAPVASRFLLKLLAIQLIFRQAYGDGGGWISGRTTWYDDAAWMSVHRGSCMYGYLGNDFGGEQNWHVGAVNEASPVFGGSCGKCFEIKCSPAIVFDGFGTSIDRTGDCLSEEPVKIAITDSCPCYKAENVFSNQRWCCGDMDHFDIGIWAFRKLADPEKGVVPILYRPIECPDWLKRNLGDDQHERSINNGQWNADLQNDDSSGGASQDGSVYSDGGSRSDSANDGTSSMDVAYDDGDQSAAGDGSSKSQSVSPPGSQGASSPPLGNNPSPGSFPNSPSQDSYDNSPSPFPYSDGQSPSPYSNSQSPDQNQDSQAWDQNQDKQSPDQYQDGYNPSRK